MKKHYKCGAHMHVAAFTKCGRMSFKEQTTTNWARVTCKSCLRGRPISRKQKQEMDMAQWGRNYDEK